MVHDEYTPLYIKIYNNLKNTLQEYEIGSNLSPERVLAEQFKVDRVTVRKALSLLAEEGLIERRQGHGTTVIRHKAKNRLQVLFLLFHEAGFENHFSEPFYANSVLLLKSVLAKENMELLHKKVRTGESIRTMCREAGADALIFAGNPDDRALEELRTVDLPTIGYNFHADGLPGVTADNGSSAAAAAQHLIRLGHRRIGFIYVPCSLNSNIRLSRFKFMMEKAGIDPANLRIVTGDWSENSGFQAAVKLLSVPEKDRVTAIFSGNDPMACGTVKAAEALGLRIPEDISVVGFDGNEQSAVLQPPLTTTRVDISSMAKASCMLLKHILENGPLDNDLRIVTGTRFIIRGSTAAPSRQIALS